MGLHASRALHCGCAESWSHRSPPPSRGLSGEDVEGDSSENMFDRLRGGGSLLLRWQGIDLTERLQRLKLYSVQMEDDGNCQFRSMAFNLFGTQEHHAVVRNAAVQYIKSRPEDFQVYFESEDKFQKYLHRMSRCGTWGDEMTLVATVKAYGCEVHVVTSSEKNWYLTYAPDKSDVSEVEGTALLPKGCKLPAPGSLYHLSYLAPLHYNALSTTRVAQTLYRDSAAMMSLVFI